MAAVVKYEDKDQFVRELDFLFNERGISGILYDYYDDNYIKLYGKYYKFPVDKLKQIFKNCVEYLTDIINIYDIYRKKKGGSLTDWFNVSYHMNLITKEKIKNIGRYDPVEHLKIKLNRIKEFLASTENEIIEIKRAKIDKYMIEDLITIINSGSLIMNLSVIHTDIEQDKLKSEYSKYLFDFGFF